MDPFVAMVFPVFMLKPMTLAAAIDIKSLTAGQYSLIYNLFSLVFAAMAFTALFLLVSRSTVLAAYRFAVTTSAMVCAIAAYHYWRIFDNFKESYPAGGSPGAAHALSNVRFNEGYRYVDWLLTVPLLLVETVAVLALAKAVQKQLLTKLVPAAVAMIILGYPGEVSNQTSTRVVWGLLSTLPFIYVLYVLFKELSSSLERQPTEVKHTVSMLRLAILGLWGVYPIAYLFPVFGGSFFGGAGGFVLRQAGYSIADILAKAAFGLAIFKIARVKSAHDDPTFEASH
jgi:bacteriorhodopsin